MTYKKAVLQIEGLKKYFYSDEHGQKQCIKAVDGVNATIYEGEVFGLVGESGCGKSTLGKSILQLYRPTEGIVRVNGIEWTNKSIRQLRQYRQDMQIVFQDPYGTLNPRVKIGEAILEPMKMHNLYKSRKEYENRLKELLNKVGLKESDSNKYPHEFSGGQRQRVGIARALSLNPKILICDEPVSALDVSIQAQILNLFKELKKELGLTLIFIAHGLNVVKYISDRIGVMYLGNLVEVADSEELFRHPLHPYTKALLSSIPIPDPDNKINPILLSGEIPSPANPPTGCRFHTRCLYARELCSQNVPDLVHVSEDKQHLVACPFYKEHST